MLTATLWVTHRKQQKSKKVIFPSTTLPNVNVLLSNITFFDFCCFRCVTHNVAVNICINCSFLHLYLLFHYRFWISCTAADLESTPVHRSAPNLAERVSSPTWSPTTIFFGNRPRGFDSVRGRILAFSYLQAVAVNTVLALPRSLWYLPFFLQTNYRSDRWTDRDARYIKRRGIMQGSSLWG